MPQKNVSRLKALMPIGPADIPSNAKKVRQAHPAVGLIKRFVGMHGKQKTYDQFVRLKTAIDKEMAKGNITSKSQYYKEVSQIIDRLVIVLQRIKQGEYGIVKLKDTELYQLVNIVGTEEVYESVKLINSYLLIQGKSGIKDRAAKLLTRISKAIDSNKVRKADPFSEELQYIQKSLSQYVEGKSERVEIKQDTLSGLEGILSGCGYPNTNDLSGTEEEAIAYEQWANYNPPKESKQRSNSLSGFPQSEAKINAVAEPKTFHPTKNNRMSVADARKVVLTTLGIQNPWRKITGDFAQDSSMMVRGKGGQGKTTFNLMFCQYFADHHGSVAYVSSEEFGRMTLKNLLDRLDLQDGKAGRIEFAEDLESINPSDFKMVVIDSKDNIGLTVDQFIDLKREHPSTFFLLVSQCTKDGDFTGKKAWEHECDINVRIEDFHASTVGEKNRWGAFSTIKYNYKGEIDESYE